MWQVQFLQHRIRIFLAWRYRVALREAAIPIQAAMRRLLMLVQLSQKVWRCQCECMSDDDLF